MSAATGAEALMTVEEPVLNQPNSKRQLAAATPVTPPAPLSGKAQCQYCLSDADFVSFFQGIYDGQRFLDHSMPEIYVQECINQQNVEVKNLFTGRL